MWDRRTDGRTEQATTTIGGYALFNGGTRRHYQTVYGSSPFLQLATHKTTRHQLERCTPHTVHIYVRSVYFRIKTPAPCTAGLLPHDNLLLTTKTLLYAIKVEFPLLSVVSSFLPMTNKDLHKLFRYVLPLRMRSAVSSTSNGLAEVAMIRVWKQAMLQ